MSPIIWAFGGALALHLVRRPRRTRPSDVLATPPIPPQQAQLTPGVVAVHGELMNNCIDPQKLTRGAALFGHEGLPMQAQALLGKAQMIHEMMHGAKSIVERCRAGDQHAMAMAQGIGEQARAGNQRAQISAFLIEEYTKKNPAPQVAQAA